MEEISKFEKIFSGFVTKDYQVTDKVFEYRMNICKTCEYNSDNVPDKDLSFVNKARKEVLKGKPFCTACGCQLKEKLRLGVEECGASSIGEKPRWNKILIQTKDKNDLNIANKSKDVHIFVKDNYFDFYVGNKEFGTIFDIEIVLFNDNIKSIDYIKQGCGGCTTLDIKNLGDTYKSVKITIDTNRIKKGKFSKNVFIGYSLKDGKTKSTYININGTTI